MAPVGVALPRPAADEVQIRLGFQVAVEVMPMLEAEAKERQKASGGDRKSTTAKKSVEERFPQEGLRDKLLARKQAKGPTP